MNEGRNTMVYYKFMLQNFLRRQDFTQESSEYLSYVLMHS